MLLKTSVLTYWKSSLILLGILYLSFAPPSTFKEIPRFEIPYLDKIIHLLIYAVFSFSLILDFNKSKSSQKWMFVWICLIFPTIIGGLIEIIQQLYFAPRTAEWIDWFSDIVGVCMGWLFYSFYNRKVIKKD